MAEDPPRWPLPPDESERLAALREYEILDTPPEQVFDDLTWLASFICQTPMALVTLIDRHRQWFKARVGFDSTETPRSESICAHAIMKPSGILEVPDASKDRRFAEMPAIAGPPSVRFYAGAPLVGASGRAVGTICVMDRKPRTLSEDQRHALRILAAQAVSQLELRVRLRAVTDRHSHLPKLQRRTLTVDELAGIAFEHVRPVAAAAGVRLATDIDVGVRAIHVDVDRMVQAIVNLLSNAIKFAPRRTAVTFGARRMADGGVSMTVHDEGGDIGPQQLERLFESNTGTASAPGLAVAKALVEEHGGSIHVTSSPETGTTFEIRLGGDGTSFAKVTASPRSDA